MEREIRDPTPPFGEVNAEGSSKVSAQGAAGEVAADARHTVEEVFGETKAQLKEVGATLQDQARSLFERHRGDVAQQIDDAAQSLRQGGAELRKQKLVSVADYVDGAADTVADVTRYLRDRETENILRDLEQATKRQPLLLYGGLFALGALGVWVFRNANDATSREA